MEACDVVGEVGCRIAQASRTFVSLRDSVFAASGDEEYGVPICGVGSVAVRC